MQRSTRQPHAKAAQYVRLGFRLFTLGLGSRGARYWWKRTNSALDVVREKDGKEKHQDLGEGHPGLPAVENTQDNLQWARKLIADGLTGWR